MRSLRQHLRLRVFAPDDGVAARREDRFGTQRAEQMATFGAVDV